MSPAVLPLTDLPKTPDQSSSSLPPQETPRQCRDETKSIVKQFLSNLRPVLQQVVRDGVSIPTWAAPHGADPKWRAHVAALNLPQINGRPSLLLHQLGDDDWAKIDPQVLGRISNIFQSEKHTYVTYFLSKTRSFMVLIIKLSRQYVRFRKDAAHV